MKAEVISYSYASLNRNVFILDFKEFSDCAHTSLQKLHKSVNSLCFNLSVKGSEVAQSSGSQTFQLWNHKRIQTFSQSVKWWYNNNLISIINEYIGQHVTFSYHNPYNINSFPSLFFLVFRFISEENLMTTDVKCGPDPTLETAFLMRSC